MPLTFAGVFQEYHAHRKRSVVWDASNLGAIRVSGPGAFQLVQRTFTNDLRRCGVGGTQYTFLLAEADASVVDDLMVWWVGDDDFLLTPNRPAAVLTALRSAPLSCAVEDVSSGRVLLAVQGAEAVARMAQIAPAAASMPPFRVRECAFDGGVGLVATTRFGGQLGFELHLPPTLARDVYRLLVDGGVTPAGLAMRETRRMEAGIPRQDLELVPGVTPLELGLAQAVRSDTEFVGREAFTSVRLRGVERVLRAVVVRGRRVPEPGSDVARNGSSVGRVTSGNFSLRLHRGLALAFVRPEVEAGSEVTIRSPRGSVEGIVTTVPIDQGAIA